MEPMVQKFPLGELILYIFEYIGVTGSAELSFASLDDNDDDDDYSQMHGSISVYWERPARGE